MTNYQLLPIGPFRKILKGLLKERAEGSVKELAEQLGVSDTRIRLWLKEDTEVVALHKADEVLSKAGIPLSSVYDYETYHLV